MSRPGDGYRGNQNLFNRAGQQASKYGTMAINDWNRRMTRKRTGSAPRSTRSSTSRRGSTREHKPHMSCTEILGPDGMCSEM